jgi:outer membrane protein assembly factor BamB
MRFNSRFVLLFVAAVVCVALAAPASGAPKGALKTIAQPIPLSAVDAKSPAACQTIQYDDDFAWYVWPSPDAFGDTMQFVRFTPGFACTLKTVEFFLYQDATVGTPGARISIYSAVGSFPDTVISFIDVPNANIVYAPLPNSVDFSAQNLVFNSDFCVVIQRIGAVSDTLVLLSDSSSTNLRSGEYYAPPDVPPVGWELIVDGWGIDIDFMIRATMCCGAPPPCVPGSQADWPTLGGSFQRTFRSSAAVSNSCQLTLDWITQGDNTAAVDISPYTNVVVSDSLAFLSFYEQLACFNTRTGDTLWKFRETGNLWLGQDLRCNVTVDDSLVYVGGASFRAFSCLRVVDGSVKWSRNVIDGGSFLGFTRFAPSVIVGDVIYMATEATPGEVWAIDKYTGANDPSWSTNPRTFAEGIVFNALSTDGDSLLFVGTLANTGALTNGRLYAVRVSNGTIKWELEDPGAKKLGNLTLDEEGFTGSLSYENGILYYQSNIQDVADGYDHFPWDGTAGAIDVNLEDGTGAGILWVVSSPVGRGLYGGPVLGEGIVYLNLDGAFTGAANPKGVMALNKSNGAVLWHNPLDGGGVPMPLTVTCEPDGTPYVFAGSRAGIWYLLNGNTGDVIWTRTFSGIVNGTAVLDSQVLVSTRSSVLGTTNGQLASFSVSGSNRSRMQVHQTTPFATNALPGSGSNTVDTIYGALSNSGCADLVISSFGIDTAALSALVTQIEPQLAARAANLADRMAPSYMGFASAFPTGPSMIDLKVGLLRGDIGDEAPATPVRSWTRRAVVSALAPQVVTVETTTPATVVAGDSLDIVIRIDETGQTPRTSVTNYVTLANNDPDFFPEDSAGTSLLPAIQVDAVFGYAAQQDTFPAIEAYTVVTNHGSFGEGTDNIFYVPGDATASLYDGTFLITGKLDDTVRTAWDLYDWAEFEPDTFLIVTYDTALGTYSGADTVYGNVAQAKYIDSIGFPESTVTYAYGVEVRETQVSFNLTQDQVDSLNWKVIQWCVINRTGSPVDSVLYLGAFADFDLEGGNNNVDTTHVNDWNAVYQYAPSSNLSAYGFVKLPAPGASYKELDGSMKTGSRYYSVYAVHNPTEVYDGGGFDPLVDHINEYLRTPGLRSRAGFARNEDMAMAVALDTVHLGPFDTAYVRMAIYATNAGGDLDDAARSAGYSANLTAGFYRGDVNADSEYDFLDIVRLYRYVVAPGSSLRPVVKDLQGDVNADGAVDMVDVVYLENYIYGGGPAPIGQWWW